MQERIAIEEFLNTCSDLLTRAEGVVKDPNKLRNNLQDLDNLLNKHWSDIIEQLGDIEPSDQTREHIQKIFNKIMELELISKTTLSLFDEMKEFVQRSTNR